MTNTVPKRNTSRTMDATKCDRLLVVIPAWNEEATVHQVVTKTREYLTSNIIVVDDCSSDQTIKIAREAGAMILPLVNRLNAWGAMQTGIRYGMKKGYRCIVTMDSDGQHLPETVPAMLEPIVTGEADIVIGSYPERGSRARKIAWSFFRLLTGLNYQDLTSGLRIYNHKAIKLLASREATLLDYQDLGILLLLRSSGLKIVEVPVTMENRENDKSRIFNSWSTVGKYMLKSVVLCLAKTGKKTPIRANKNKSQDSVQYPLEGCKCLHKTISPNKNKEDES
jgi:glycosyltransferase involved in cell wall biosynthesis